MINVQQKKEKILSFIKTNGPSLPIKIARAIEMEPIFASAITSELLNEKKIKMSHMKVGASSLYLIEGQEQKLEEHVDNLRSIEKEAFLKLKNKKVLIDEKEEPPIRVALRNIRDFAIPFKFKERIMWRYSFIPEEEIKNILVSKEKTIQKEPEKERTTEKETKEAKEEKTIKETEKEPEKKTAEKEIKKEKTIQREAEKKVEEIFDKEPKPEFLKEVKNFLRKKDIEFLEEIKTEKKEIVAKVKLKTSLGDFKLLLVAKNKLTTNKEEVNSALQLAKYNKVPCLFLIRKEPKGAIKKFLEDNYLIILKVLTG